MSSRTMAVLLAAAFGLAAGCANSPNRASPIAASQPPGIDAFVGGWTSPFSTSLNGTPTGCSQFDYTIDKKDANAANVTYDLVCAGYAVKGTGDALLQGSVLKWNASGTVSGGMVNCAFAFTDNSATPQGDDKLLVTYNATVCGVGPFSGSTVLQRR